MCIFDGGELGSTGVVRVQGDRRMERMPLKWEIPHHLLEKHIREAAAEMWLGAKIRL